MAVITISRQYASGGDEIAARVCEMLGYKPFDKRLIAQAARDAGLSDQEVINFSEEDRKIRGFFDRLFGWSELSSLAHAWGEDASAVLVTDVFKLSEESIVILVEKAIHAARQMGNVVIVGRGGQVVLRDQPDVLHVRVEAPMEERIQRVKEQLKQARTEFNADIDVRRDAQDEIEQKDAASREYIQRYYRMDWSSPLLYHLVLNASKLSVEQAAGIIAGLARASRTEENPAQQAQPSA